MSLFKPSAGDVGKFIISLVVLIHVQRNIGTNAQCLVTSVNSLGPSLVSQARPFTNTSGEGNGLVTIHTMFRSTGM